MPKKQPKAVEQRPALLIGLFNGKREPLDSAQQVLLRVRDGFQHELLSTFKKGSSFPLRVEVPFYDNLGDNYTVIASAKGCHDVGFTPIKISASGDTAVDLMLLPKKGQFKFLDWQQLTSVFPAICQFIGCGLKPADAQAKYEQLRSERSPTLAALLNLAVAMSQIQLQSGTPLDYIKELKWDKSMAQDRFFAYCDPALIDQVKLAVKANIFTEEPGPGIFHPGATSSYKQKQFGEADVQLTFHEKDTKKIDNTICITVEPDIDYYSDLGAHTLLEVIPNTIGHGLTDPKMVYVLRWIAGRHAGMPEFNPPYTIE